MNQYADLELGIHRRDAESYVVELRFSGPGEDGDIRLQRGTSPSVLQLESAKLRALQLDPAAYGRYLGAQLFADPQVLAALSEARARAVGGTVVTPLRLRLFVGPSAVELHNVRWETLRDVGGEPLVMGEHLLFSRYLSSGDWQPVRLRPKGDLRGLVLIAGPSDLADYRLAAVDVPNELDRARAGLGDMTLTMLAEQGTARLTTLIEQLRDAAHEDKPFDVLYLVAHGAYIGGESWLWLENAEGKALRIAGSDLVQRIHELPQRPRLVVLASCQSAGDGKERHSADNGALAALGPALAEAGVPAVVAFQGNISMETVARFMPAFFRELQRDGQIDRALAVARGTVRERPDAWMPVLYMRLKSGQLWYVPGFGKEGDGFEKWPAIISSIEKQRCTPIIGTHMSEFLLGSSRDIAHRWAETFNFPLRAAEREDLPQVAQYLSVNQEPLFPHEQLANYLGESLLDRYGELLTEDLRENGTAAELFAAVGKIVRERNPHDPYRVIAELPFPVYVTTNATNMLVEALRAAGKDPQIELCRWNEEVEMLPSIYDDEPDYQPSVERPLVYFLFGIINEPASVVLTEDDYFDFLISATANKDLIPIAVRRALADTALLFLGFRLDDWNFRVLFRTLMKQEGRSRRQKYAHIAGQIMPEEGRFLEPERARSYLENYFQDSDISIFWGSSEDFMRALHHNMQQQPHAQPKRAARKFF
jgi:hypothetical protein